MLSAYCLTLKSTTINYLKKSNPKYWTAVATPRVTQRQYKYFPYLNQSDRMWTSGRQITDIATCHAMHINGEGVSLTLFILPLLICIRIYSVGSIKLNAFSFVHCSEGWLTIEWKSICSKLCCLYFIYPAKLMQIEWMHQVDCCF